MSKHGIAIKDMDILDGKYKVLNHIASGGMSEVFLVEDIHNPNQKWAVKVVNKENTLSPKLIDETKILSQLDHPNIPRMIDFFTNDAYIYLVMEYAEGTVLSDYFVKNNYHISMKLVTRIGIQLCDILSYLHNRENPIIYRDIKPGNIILQEDGNINLIDFGISRKFQEGKMRDTVKIGTVGFAAPEQFEHKQTDERTDLFSLGSLLYYLLSGGKYVYIAQKPISRIVRRLPKSLKKCINQLVELDPEKRIQNAEDAKRLLVRASKESRKKKSVFPIYLTMFVILVLIALAYIFLMK